MKDETKQALFDSLNTEESELGIQLLPGFEVQERRDADNKLIGVDVDVLFTIDPDTSKYPLATNKASLNLHYMLSPQMSEAIQAAEGKPEQESLLSDALLYFTLTQMHYAAEWMLAGKQLTCFDNSPTLYTPGEVDYKEKLKSLISDMESFTAVKKEIEVSVIEEAKKKGFSDALAEVRIIRNSRKPINFIVTFSGTKHGAHFEITEDFHNPGLLCLNKNPQSSKELGNIVCVQLFLKADGLVKDYVSLGRTVMPYKVAGTMFALGAAASSVATLALTGVIEFAKLATAAGIVFSNPVTAVAATAVFLVAAIASFGLGARASHAQTMALMHK